jgi:hypothetical protein
MTQRYYPNSHPPRLNEDLRLLYDGMYKMQDQLAKAHARIGELEKPAAKQPEPGGPSNTKITGIAVKGVPPGTGTSVTTMKGIPTLGYNSATGQIEWYITTT